jgi:hypothetical protein
MNQRESAIGRPVSLRDLWHQSIDCGALLYAPLQSAWQRRCVGAATAVAVAVSRQGPWLRCTAVEHGRPITP